MCGIAGIYRDGGGPIDRAALARMGDAIAHRGPDGEGSYVEDEEGPSVGLVSRRLAVIDIPGGRQPMTVADGAYTIVYNGELFNAAEVRRELEGAGHRFRSACDTEVVVSGYAQWGVDVLERLNGMWALAIWDRPRRRLFLARDRLGVKPLVYAQTPQGLLFGSEIKALTASGAVARALDLGALPHYLSAFAIPEPHTLVRGVRRLPAAHAVLAGPGGVREFCYWDCAVPEEPDRGADAYRDEVGALLGDAVGRRLVSDVPLGVLLSGGVDSGLVATFAARAAGAPPRTFTLGFDVAGADERAPARALATSLGAVHRDELVGAAEAARALPALLAAYDEPGQSLVQTHFVSRLARREVTVALSGLGGDELFSGYPTHVVVNLLARLDRAPAALRAALAEAARVLPIGRLRRLAALAAMDPDERVTRRLLHQTDGALRAALLSGDARAAVDLDAPARHLEAHYERARAHHPLNRLLYVYLKTYLPDELLRATDAMSMLHGLEVRTPFLDHRLVERAMSMPAERKMRLRTGKLVLRDVARETLPRPSSAVKRGFSPPLGAWLQGALGEQVRDVLAAPTVRRRGLFDPREVQRVVNAALGGDARAVAPAMMLYAFETWAQRWLDAPPAPVSAPVVLRRPAPELSVIVASWNTRELLRECLASVAEHLGGVAHEVIVVDNGSGDGSADMVAAAFPDARLVRNGENAGFGAANNQAMRAARGRWLLLLNSDARLADDSVAGLLGRVGAQPGVGIAHCRLRFPDGRLQHTTYRFPSLRLAVLEDLGLYKLAPRRAPGALLAGYWDHDRERDVDWVAGAFMLVRREVFEQIGGFDERLFMYGEDMDWCRRARDHGWRVRFYPQATVVHHDHASSELRWGEERVALCLRRQRDFYAAQRSPARARALMGVRTAGAGLRLGYYALRGALGGARAGAYRAMRPSLATTFRSLLALALERP